MINDDQIKGYLEVVGKKGLKTLGIIETLRPVVERSESDLGKEFLKEDIEQFVLLFNKTYDSLIKTGTADQKEVIALQLLHHRLLNISEKLNLYEDMVKKVKERK